MSDYQLFEMLLGFGFIALVFIFISYVLTSFSYYKMFLAYNYQNPVYAFIPFYNLYILSNLTCGSIFRIGEFEIEKKYFVWWWLLAYIIAFIPAIGGFLSFIINIICLGFCYNEGIKRIDNNFDSKVLAYVSAIISIVLWFLVLPKRVNK